MAGKWNHRSSRPSASAPATLAVDALNVGTKFGGFLRALVRRWWIVALCLALGCPKAEVAREGAKSDAGLAAAGAQFPRTVVEVTNGVHMPSWDSAAADDLWTEACAKDRWLGTMDTLERRTFAASQTPGSGDFAPPPASLLWNTHARDYPGNWPPPARAAEAVNRAKNLFDPKALTMWLCTSFRDLQETEPAA